MKRIYLLVFVVFTIAQISAQSSWQGSAAVSRFGELPSSGYYGASDSFPKNTKIKVTNLSQGTEIEITILKDLSSEPGLFILLSPAAGEVLGMERDEIIQVSAVVDRSSSDQLVDIYKDDNFNPDPEVNPRADGLIEEVEQPGEYYVTPTEEAELATPEESTAIIEDTPIEVVEVPVEPDIPFTEEPQITPFPSGEAALDGTLEQNIDKVVSLPPREDDFFRLVEEEEIPTEEEILLALQESDTPEISLPEETPIEEPEVLISEDLELPAEDEYEVAELPEAVLPVEEPESVEITLEPTEMKPPVVEDLPDEPLVVYKYDGELPTWSTLDPGKNYIQIGTYRTDRNIEKIIMDLKSILPIAILKKPEEPNLLRLMAGPLPEDQIGVLYYYCRDLGFRDSFIIRRRE